MALGQSIIAKKFFGVFRAIAKNNFPEILFPPRGGINSWKIRKLCPANLSSLFLTALGQSFAEFFFGGIFGTSLKLIFRESPSPPSGGNGFGLGPKA